MKHLAFEISKQERETNLSLIRRFSKRFRETGILSSAKKAMFQRRKKGKNNRRQSTLRKLQKKQEYEKLMKLGL